MDKHINQRKVSVGLEWIRSAETGTGYLCPLGAIKDKENVSEEELRALCLDESFNPQND